MPDILASAKTSTPPLLPVRADVDLPFSSHATSLPQEPEPEPAIPPPVGNKKRGSKSLILAVLLFLLATLPLAVYFTSQQRQLADNRGRAQEGPYPANYLLCLKNATIEECAPLLEAKTPTSGTTTCVCDFCNFASSTGPGTCTNGIKQTARPGCAASASQCTSTTTPTSGTISSGNCGGEGQVCCPSNRTDGGNICNGNLYCNGSTCQTTAPANLCQGNQGSAGTAGTKCKIYRCGSRCNNGNQCNLGESIVDCGTSLGECGQIDWLDTNDNYCGVKEQNCGGSCAGTVQTSGPGGAGQQPVTQQPTPTATPTPVPTSTPTPIAGPQCRNIKLYKGNNVVQPSELARGDQITISIVGSNATKARARVNGGEWVETTTKNAAGEYTIEFTIPSAGGTFAIEAEVHQNGVWQ